MDDNWTYPTVEFVADQRRFTFEERQVGRFKAGKEVVVLYLPDNPRVARLGGAYLFRAAWVYGLGAAAFGAMAYSFMRGILT